MSEHGVVPDGKIVDQTQSGKRKKSLIILYIKWGRTEREYNKRVRQVKNGSFTSLIFSINDGIGRDASKFYRSKLKILVEKRSENKSINNLWIGRKLK